eukprot:15578312-Heterocapsa_arctica.AAC.1
MEAPTGRAPGGCRRGPKKPEVHTGPRPGRSTVSPGKTSGHASVGHAGCFGHGNFADQNLHG